jgi:hypothetical protein
MSTRVRQLVCLVILTAAIPSTLVKAAPNSDFNALYDFYFANPSPDIKNEYRSYFDSILFGPPLSERYRKRDRAFYHAFRGDTRALHEFLTNEDRNLSGEFGMFWARECLVLLLKWGDAAFASCLNHESRSTKAIVGYSIDGPVEWGWKRYPFPKTRAIYKDAEKKTPSP